MNSSGVSLLRLLRKWLFLKITYVRLQMKGKIGNLRQKGFNFVGKYITEEFVFK